MLIHASSYFEMQTTCLVPGIFMVRARSAPNQLILEEKFTFTPQVTGSDYIDGYGNIAMRLLIPAGESTLESSVIAECPETIDVNMDAAYIPIELLPDNVLQFLLPSRYCESDKVTDIATAITGGIQPGYAQVECIRQWVHANFTRQYGTTNSTTSALDVLQTRMGVCRDFTHAAIALCRNLDIPARMVAGYLLGLEPMDLHAWFEAYVGDRWYTFDALMDQPKGGRIVMAYGRDAADVAFASHFGNVVFQKMIINVKEIT